MREFRCVRACVLGAGGGPLLHMQSESEAVMELCFQRSRARYPLVPIMCSATSLALNIQRLNTAR